MSKYLVIPSLVMVGLIQVNTLAAAEANPPSNVNKEYCSNNKLICITPMLTNKSSLVLNHDKVELEVTQTNLGAKFTIPNKAYFVKFNGSVLPLIKADSVKEDYNASVDERTHLGAEYLKAQLSQNFALAQKGVAEALAKAGVPPTSPMYKSLFSKYLQPYADQIQAAGAAAQAAGTQKVAHARREADYRTPELVLQDSFQEVVMGYDDGTYFFRVGKFSAGVDMNSRNISEMGQYVAQRPATDELQTTGQGRSNIEFGRRDYQLKNGLKISLVAFVGKEGRVFISAIQDTNNALRMSDEAFRADEKLVGFNNGGGKLKIDLGDSGNSLTLIGMSGPQGPTGGAEVRMKITPDVIGHVAYLYANKFGAQGHQVRGQIDYHVGKALGAEWVVAFYDEYARVQDYSALPIEVDSESGMVQRNQFGAALTAVKNDALIKGLQASATLDLGYRSAGTVDDATHFLTHQAIGPEVVDDGFIGSLQFQAAF